MKNILIIGAGLSGIYLATLLQKQFNVTVLEARDRIGGRILTVDGFDMGPSWVWSHQHNILKLIAENALGIFQQYTKGVALYDTPGGVEHFTPPPSAPSARIKGGVITLVDALAEKLHSDTVRLNAVVTAVEQSGQKLLVKTEEKIFEADIVISTLPPRLAVEKIAYLPPLSPDLLTQLAAIPTWMGYSAKCTVEFEAPFWRHKGLSGSAFSHIGPLGELHDSCTESKAALFGFFHSHAQDKSPEAVRAQMMRLFGKDAAKIKNIYITDWSREAFTSVRADRSALAAHPNYGFDADAFDGRLIFTGTESAFQDGGYLEGAVLSADKTVKKLRLRFTEQ